MDNEKICPIMSSPIAYKYYECGFKVVIIECYESRCGCWDSENNKCGFVVNNNNVKRILNNV